MSKGFFGDTLAFAIFLILVLLIFSIDNY